MSAEDTRQLVLRFVDEVWGKGDLAVGRSILAADLIDRHPRPGQAPGVEGFLDTVKLYTDAFPVRRFMPERPIIQGDEAATSWEMMAFHQGEFRGRPPSNQLVTVTGADWLRVNDGRIVEIWHEQDVFGALMMLSGVLP